MHINDAFCHESERELGEEDLLVSFEETTGDPLVDCDTDHQDKELHTLINIFLLLSLVNSLEEEVLEGLERVLVHVVDNPQLDQQEVKHGTFSGNWTIRFS